MSSEEPPEVHAPLKEEMVYRYNGLMLGQLLRVVASCTRRQLAKHSL